MTVQKLKQIGLHSTGSDNDSDATKFVDVVDDVTISTT